MNGKHSTFVALLLFYGITNPVLASGTNEDRRVQAQDDVATLLRAVYANEPKTVLQYTHEKIINLMGGRAEALALTSKALAQLTPLRMKIERLEFPADPVFITTSSMEYVLVPTKTVLLANGKRLESLNYQFGARAIGKTGWKYIEGSRINKLNVRDFFPDFPKDQDFPKTYRKVIEEQD